MLQRVGTLEPSLGSVGLVCGLGLVTTLTKRAELGLAFGLSPVRVPDTVWWATQSEACQHG
jgi:hypothetical protein